MITKIIEATNVDAGGINWGKFMVSRFSEEWTKVSVVDQTPLLRGRGWAHFHVMVTDLQTGEGAIFRPGGHPGADLNKHKIWVCPMFEPFLEWLYRQDLSDITKLPDEVKIKDPASSLSGYRRQGPQT